LLEFDAIQFDQLETVHKRVGNRVTHVAPSSTFKTQDEHYVTLAASTQSIWLRLCRAMELEDLISNPKFLDNSNRLKHSEEINGIVAAWIAERTRKEVEEAFERHEVAYSFVYDIADIFNDEHFRIREMLIRVLDKELGGAVVQNVIPKFSKTPGSVDFLGPTMGEHNNEIYCGELGYSKEKLKQLKDAGII
jgi:crotonobetainyl-CoA:carnitine CoA-transferase CaiB-like acyl-CoA transferase